MSKQWDGLMPWDNQITTHSGSCKQEGYVTAMNSPVIKQWAAATEGLLGDRPQCHDGTMTCGGCDYCQLERAYAAYERGLKEEA